MDTISFIYRAQEAHQKIATHTGAYRFSEIRHIPSAKASWKDYYKVLKPLIPGEPRLEVDTDGGDKEDGVTLCATTTELLASYLHWIHLYYILCAKSASLMRNDLWLRSDK